MTHQEHIRWVFQHQKPVFSRIFQLVEEENSYAVSLQVPVFRGDSMVGTLATVLRPDRVIPVLIPEPLRLDKAARLWCIQEDGYVLYDNDLNQVGTYLFKNQTCSVTSPCSSVVPRCARNRLSPSLQRSTIAPGKGRVFTPPGTASSTRPRNTSGGGTTGGASGTSVRFTTVYRPRNTSHGLLRAGR